LLAKNNDIDDGVDSGADSEESVNQNFIAQRIPLKSLTGIGCSHEGAPLSDSSIEGHPRSTNRHNLRKEAQERIKNVTTLYKQRESERQHPLSEMNAQTNNSGGNIRMKSITTSHHKQGKWCTIL